MKGKLSVSQLPAERVLLCGETGSGKTYTAINNYPGKYAYIAPCQQLVYEVFQDYGDVTTKLQTGEVSIPGIENGNFMGTYEAFDEQNVKKYNRIIIDESQFLADYDRGGHLLDILNEAKKESVDVLLLTATPNLSDALLEKLDIRKESLESFSKGPQMIEVDYDKFIENAKEGQQSIYFCKYTPGVSWISERSDILNIPESKIAILSASNTAMERIKVQNDFREGKINFLICTNVLAQGLNFPTTNILIEDNEYDTGETIQQKKGRLGRPGFSEGVESVFYTLYHRDERYNRRRGERVDDSYTKDFNKTIQNKSKIHETLSHRVQTLTNISDIANKPLSSLYLPHMMIDGDKLSNGYGSSKYCFKSIQELIITKNVKPEYATTIQELYDILRKDRQELSKYLSERVVKKSVV